MAISKSSMNNKEGNLKQRTQIGLFWSIGNQFSKQILSFVTTLFLIRLLLPADFGLISMVLVFSSLSTLLIDFGYRTAIIQRSNLTAEDLSSIFWLNLGLGLFFTSLLYLFAPKIATIYDEPKVIPIAQAIAFLYLTLSLYMVPKALLEKQLDFKSITIAETSGSVISSIAALVLAYANYGVWALVALQLIKHFWILVIIWFKAKWRPMLVFKTRSIREIGKFSTSVLYSSFLYYLSVNVDRFLIGKQIGKTEVGLYDKSFTLAAMPKRNMSQLILSVLFSSFSKIQTEQEKIKKIYLLAMRIIAFLNFPLMIGILVSTRPFVLVIFGEHWLPMISFLQIFSVVLIFNSFSTLLGSIILAKGENLLIKKDATIRQGVIILGAVLGVSGGSLGVAFGILIASIFNFVLTLHHAHLSTSLLPKNQLKNIQTIFFGSVFMGITIHFIQPTFSQFFSTFWLLISNILLGCGIYFGYLYWKKDNTIKELHQILTKQVV